MMGDQHDPGPDDMRRRRFPAARLRRPGTGSELEDGSGQEVEPEVEPSRSPFAPRSFAGGRVQVFGCSPGFLLLSLVVSVVLTILLNLFF